MSNHTVPHHDPEDNGLLSSNHPDDPAVRQALEIISASVDVDHLTICFLPDGRADFYPDTFKPERLYHRLKRLLKILRQHPGALRCAAGACQGGHHHEPR